MTMPIEPQPVPLIRTPEGVIRISGTRVHLETVVRAFQDGASPKEIAQDYPLTLASVYAVITTSGTEKRLMRIWLSAGLRTRPYGQHMRPTRILSASANDSQRESRPKRMRHEALGRRECAWGYRAWFAPPAS